MKTTAVKGAKEPQVSSTKIMGGHFELEHLASRDKWRAGQLTELCGCNLKYVNSFYMGKAPFYLISLKFHGMYSLM